MNGHELIVETIYQPDTLKVTCRKCEINFGEFQAFDNYMVQHHSIMSRVFTYPCKDAK